MPVLKNYKKIDHILMFLFSMKEGVFFSAFSIVFVVIQAHLPWVGGGGGKGLVVCRDPLVLPPPIAMPDGEETPYGSFTSAHIRDPLQVSPTPKAIPDEETLAHSPVHIRDPLQKCSFFSKGRLQGLFPEDACFVTLPSKI